MAVTRKGAKRFLFLEILHYIGSVRLLVTAKMAHKQLAIATTLCKELQASNCVYKSQGAPARGIGPPLV